METTLEEAQARIKELEPLTQQLSEASSQISKLTETNQQLTADKQTLEATAKESVKSIADLTTERDSLKVDATSFENRLSEQTTSHEVKLAESSQQTQELRQVHDSLLSKYTLGIKGRLVQNFKIGADLLEDKTVDQLEAMEIAAGATKPADGVTAANLGLHGGGGSVPEQKSTIEHNLDWLEKAASRNKN